MSDEHWRLEKRCCTVCETKKTCHVCGDQTLLVCSDCAINFRATIYVCRKSTCRDEHERLCVGDGHKILIPRAQHDALMAAYSALDQCIDDFGPDGRCVCQQAKEQAIEAIAKCRAAGIEIEELEEEDDSTSSR